MTTPAGPAAHRATPSPTPVQNGEDWLWARVPGGVWPRSPMLGMTLSDGGWLRAWPGAALAVPLVSFVLGLYRGGFRPADQQTYSYSLTWLLVLIVVTACGGAIGAWLFAGFVIGDALFFDHVSSYFGTTSGPWTWLKESVAPPLVADVLLALLLIGIPFTALVVRGCLYGVLRQTPAAAVVAAVGGGLAAGVQAAAWTQSFPLLVRPAWTWRHAGTPPVEAIMPVQQHPILIGLVTAAASGLLAWVSFASIVRLGGRRLQPVPFGDRARRRTPTAGPPLRAVASVLMLAGLIDSWRNGFIVFGILLAAFSAQAWVVGRLAPMRWWMARVPLVVRLLLTLVVAWVVAWLIGRTAVTRYSFGFSQITAHTFAPLLFGCVAAIAVTALLLPRAAPLAGPPSGEPQ